MKTLVEVAHNTTNLSREVLPYLGERYNAQTSGQDDYGVSVRFDRARNVSRSIHVPFELRVVDRQGRTTAHNHFVAHHDASLLRGDVEFTELSILSASGISKPFEEQDYASARTTFRHLVVLRNAIVVPVGS